MYYDNEPMEPPLEVFFDVIRAILESPYTVEKTRDVAVLLLVCTTVNRSLLTTIYMYRLKLLYYYHKRSHAGRLGRWGAVAPDNPRLTEDQKPNRETGTRLNEICGPYRRVFWALLVRPKCICPLQTPLGELLTAFPHTP